MRRCPVCLRLTDDWAPQAHRCRSCDRVRSSNYYSRNAAKVAARRRVKRELAEADAKAIRDAVIRIWGGCCQNCGRTDSLDLDLPAQAMAAGKARQPIYHAALKSGRPVRGVELRCVDCRRIGRRKPDPPDDPHGPPGPVDPQPDQPGTGEEDPITPDPV